MIAFTVQKPYPKPTLILVLIGLLILIPSLSLANSSPCFRASDFGDPQYNSIYCDAGFLFEGYPVYISPNGTFLYTNAFANGPITFLFDNIIPYNDEATFRGYYVNGGANVMGSFAVDGGTSPAGTMSTTSYGTFADLDTNDFRLEYLVDIFVVAIIAFGVVYLLTKKV